MIHGLRSLRFVLLWLHRQAAASSQLLLRLGSVPSKLGHGQRQHLHTMQTNVGYV
jgi:hypothetical protein